jgi:integrase
VVRQVFAWMGGAPRGPHHSALRARHISLDRKPPHCRSDRTGTADGGAQDRKPRSAGKTAHRALGNCGQVFRYAIANGRATRDPSSDLRGALPPVKGEHFAAITEPKRVAELLRAIDGYAGTLTVRCALRLAPLVFVRPGELRKAEWADFDLDAAE